MRDLRSLYWKFIKSHNQGGYNTPQEFTATTKKKRSKKKRAKGQERGSRNKKKTDKKIKESSTLDLSMIQ
jgi:hypothetical protein